MTPLSLFQALLPQHLISQLAGYIANAEQPQFKSWLISSFIKHYAVDMQDAEQKDLAQFKSFNEFFIRRLTADSRPINRDQNVIVSPADGQIAEMGYIAHDQLIQAKSHYFTLHDLLGGETLSSPFINGAYATIYLAPHNYHRVHMPYDGKLVATYFIPGTLFSVNAKSAKAVPSLYSRNERLVCLFENERIGKFAVILVGAMIVGSIQLVFEDHPVRSKELTKTLFDHPHVFKKGEELAHFKLGSTVIVLFEKDKVVWDNNTNHASEIQFGMRVASLP